MQVSIQSKGFQPSETLVTRIGKEAAKLPTFADDITNCLVILGHQKQRFDAEIVLNVYRRQLRAGAEAELPETAVDTAFDRAVAQLKRHKEKLKDHRAPGARGSEGSQVSSV
jgi:putative sigma-54 modulation protein